MASSGVGGGSTAPSRVASNTAESLGVQVLSSLGGNFTATSVATANKAYFIPFRLDAAVTLTQMFSMNGGTASGNLDVGIYSEAGSRLVSSGSTAQSGTTAMQIFNVTDTALAAGRYYLAVAQDNATGTLYSCTLGTVTLFGRAMGALVMASAFPLPSTATFALLDEARIPLIGFTTLTVI